ncbi:MAG: deoxyribonuclease IV [Clostridia bacterium]|nr:deoxyribonuclease IV [Clostridia bacterium]
MFKIGCHLSASKGYLAMGKEAVSIGANTFQFFTRNPRGGSIKPLDLDDIASFIEFAQKNNIGQILAHAPYTLNPCAEKEYIRNFTLETMKDDISRLEHIPGTLYNFHPGSHVGQGAEAGIRYIAEILNEILFEDMTTVVLLETMSGKGSEVGKTFEELRAIIDRVKLSSKIGVCLDTCHIFDGGYDIVENLDGVLTEFDNIIGLDRLRAIHLNDTKNPLASHKDRHEKIGGGYLGIEAITRIINHPKLRELPFLLETPNELDGYAKEIALLKEKYKNA